MQAWGQVLQIEAGRVWLRVSDTGGGCGRCDEPGGCRSVQITQAFGLPKSEFALPTRLELKAGDRVVISTPDGAPLKAAMASYGLGAVLLVAGAACGGIAAANDLGVAAGGAAGLLLAFALNRLLARSRGWRAQLHMELAPQELASQAACLRPLQESR
ncbi:SoxR reducing system RseC family protein [Thauera linaloolentis]|nr:SoxR reducing system RseC family protein [Thauera linaloolentis]MCM8564880.1 SoxR reducing system RseC family protein [Thauera linaloolentis]